ncbi:hypothetical protein PABG_03319 [Paracoccidioides brasiliensis Pb03]|nr:hypothetical protein PABG_03319 [Paracoccidioides brasiliensis Pb03]
MYISFVIILGILTTFISALPAGDSKGHDQVTVQLINDRTGAWGSVRIRLDNKPKNVVDLFQKKPVFSDGTVKATSMQMTRIIAGAHCRIEDEKTKKTIMEIDDRKTFDNVDGSDSKVPVINLKGSTICCWVSNRYSV